MGGIGKTTHAAVLYDRISYQFGACCFIENVSKIYKDKGAIEVQKQILRQTLDEKNLDTYSPSEISGIIRNRLYNFKVLVVLDNVDDSEQFIELKIKPELLGAGSRMIITTRDEHILKVCGADEFYNVPPLSNNDARELFFRKAFKRFSPDSSCEELIPEVLKYAQCLPLAIGVLGSFLSHRDDTQWRDALYRLEKNADNKIMDVLRISYEGLTDTDKEIFLHIACFFNGERVDYVTRILDCCCLTPRIGIQVIIERSLIIIRNDEIHMHEMLQGLGRNIVQRQFPGNPTRWSRLWLYEDFRYVMTSRMGTNNVEAIVLNQKAVHVPEHIMLEVEEFSRMENLKLLILHHQNFSGNLDFLSNGLCYLMWHGYPFISLPPEFRPDRLVELNMPNSYVKRLWEGVKHLPSLKMMDLSNSIYIEETPNFEGIPNLERLDLSGCTNLMLIHPSIGLLEELVFLSLRNCCSLVNLTLMNRSLQVLYLSGCTRLEKTPQFSELSNLQYLDLERCTRLSTVHESIWKLQKLRFLSLRGCINLVETLSASSSLVTPDAQLLSALVTPGTQSLSVTSSLVTLDLCGCASLKNLVISPFYSYYFNMWDSIIFLDLGSCNLSEVPDGFKYLRCLERLNLKGNKFVSLPIGVMNLSRLAYLNLAHCHELKAFPALPSGEVAPLAQGDPSVGNYFKVVSGSRNHRSGLYIFDCPKLDDSSIVSALPWLFKLVQEPRHFRCGFDIVVPSDVVPMWFYDQFKGDSIIRIVECGVDDNWIGFAFCVAFKANRRPSISYSSHNSFTSDVPHRFYLSFETEEVEETFDMPLCLDLNKIGSLEHLWLIYISRPHCHFAKSGAHITFKAHPDLEIMKWGFRMVFEQDIMEEGRLRPNKAVPVEPESFSGPSFNYVHESRGNAGSKVQLPYNWLVTDEELNENMEAKEKEDNVSNVGLTTNPRKRPKASS